ncbi:hypothetical protein V8D89_007844 [Ganoderma adspersum]
MDLDACPEEISDPQIRASWGSLTAEIKGILLGGISQHQGRATNATNRLQGIVLLGSRVETGMPPPQGNPYVQSEEERGRTRSCEGDRRRRLSRDGRYTPIRQEQSAEAAIDPVLLALSERRDRASPPVRTPPVSIRGRRNALYTARGGVRVWRSAHQGDSDAEDDEDDDEPFALDDNIPKDDSDPLVLALLKVSELDAMQKLARKDIMAVVRKQFREVTKVKDGSPWPVWREPMLGMEVNFEANVDQSMNEDLIIRVAEVSMQILKSRSQLHADWMNAPSVKLTLRVLCEFAKKTFRGFKVQYAAQLDIEKAQQLRKNERNSRWQSRRNTKCEKLLSMVDAYTEKYGIDPTDLLTPDMMSDEASGPEDDDEGSEAEWKRKMAAKAGISGRSDAQLAKMSFFEVVKPDWRSDELSKIFHELWELFWDSASTRAIRTMTTRVRDTERSSGDRIPLVAPYNFGINVEWYNAHKVTSRKYLKDWFKHPDPQGFGTNRNVVPEGASASNPGPSESA